MIQYKQKLLKFRILYNKLSKYKCKFKKTNILSIKI